MPETSPAMCESKEEMKKTGQRGCVMEVEAVNRQGLSEKEHEYQIGMVMQQSQTVCGKRAKEGKRMGDRRKDCPVCKPWFFRSPSLIPNKRLSEL